GGGRRKVPRRRDGAVAYEGDGPGGRDRQLAAAFLGQGLAMTGSRLLVRTVETVARHVRVPVRERAQRIVLPRPHVQRVERRQPEAVWRVEEVKELSIQLGRMRVILVPVGGEHQIV